MRNTTGYHPSQLTNHKSSAQSYMCTTGYTMRKTGRYYNSYDKPKSPIGHVNEYPTMHYFGNPGHSVNDSIHNFDWVFPEIPARYCILGYSLTCPIKAKQQRTLVSKIQWKQFQSRNRIIKMLINWCQWMKSLVRNVWDMLSDWMP